MLVWPFGSPSLPRSTVKRTLSPTAATGGELRPARSRAGRTDLRPHGRLASNAAQRQSSDASSATWVRSTIDVPARPLGGTFRGTRRRALLAIGAKSGKSLQKEELELKQQPAFLLLYVLASAVTISAIACPVVLSTRTAALSPLSFPACLKWQGNPFVSRRQRISLLEGFPLPATEIVLPALCRRRAGALSSALSAPAPPLQLRSPGCELSAPAPRPRAARGCA